MASGTFGHGSAAAFSVDAWVICPVACLLGLGSSDVTVPGQRRSIHTSRPRVRAALAGTALIGAVGVLAATALHDDESRTERPADAVALLVNPDARQAARRSGADLDVLVGRPAEEAFARLGLSGPVRLTVQLEPLLLIPEVGVGGTADPRQGVVISIGDTLPKESQAWLRAIVVHELHHIARLRADPPGTGGLGDAIVTEGLAEHFIDELLPDTPPRPYLGPMSPELESSLWEKAKRHLRWGAEYDYGEWFSGGPDLPSGAVHKLGYRIVGAYLAADKRPPSKLVAVDAAVVIAEYERIR